jgi:D-lactate dehydrogenase (cytochrome)
MHIDVTLTRPPLDPGFVAALRQRFGDALDMSASALAQHGASEAHFAPMAPDAVVYAGSTDDVVDLVRMCTAAMRWRCAVVSALTSRG